MPSITRALRTALLGSVLSALCVVGASAACVGAGTVTADALRLRSEANTESSILATATLGDTVVVLEEAEDNWYKVDYLSIEGYMSGEYLDIAPQADVAIGYGVVQTDGATLNVRTGPSTDCELVTVLYPGTVVTINGVDNGWYKISHGGATGYVSSDYMVTCKDSAGSRGDGAVVTSSSPMGQQVVEYAKQSLGKPYVWGGNGPNSFDCSGFTKYVYAHFGYTLNRTASAQLSNGVSVSRSELQPGDLVFFYNGRVSTPVSHVGIYVGDGQFIHASTNTYAVQYDSLYSNHYNNTYVYARRIF